MADKNAAKRKKAIERFDREENLPGGFARLKDAVSRILATPAKTPKGKGKS